MIDPRVLRGFRDSLPARELFRERIQNTLEQVFKSFGFVPIDTPVLEYAEILLGKGGGETDKQVYRFLDHGRRDIALRFDLTVPFARFMASHLHELYLPFRRYQIGKVWRGENTQRGRYREFTQIDFDIVGVDAASTDFEILLVMQNCFTALGINKFKIHLSERQVFNQYLEKLGLRKKSGRILRTIDKLKRIGREKVLDLLSEIDSRPAAEKILSFIEMEDTNEATLKKLAAAVDPDSEAVKRLFRIDKCITECGLKDFFRFDPSVTRGLDYYTGIVFETFLADLPDIGSVCSGGRYNDLASLYTREKLPGVGSSVGLDRLVAALGELGLAEEYEKGPDLIILFLDDPLLSLYHKYAIKLREAGLSVDIFPSGKKLAAQFNYAEKRAISLALICGEEERAEGKVTLKDLKTRKSYESLTIESLIDIALKLLQS